MSQLTCIFYFNFDISSNAFIPFSHSLEDLTNTADFMHNCLFSSINHPILYYDC